jgi:hypothetical protein
MGFIPELWGDKTLNQILNALKEQQRVVNSVTDYTPMVLDREATGYHGPKLGANTAVDLPASTVTSAAQSSIDISFSQKKGVLFSVSDIDKGQASVDLVESQTEDARNTLLDAYDLYLLQTMIDGLKSTSGYKNTITDTVGNKLSLADIRDARKKLNKSKAPLKGRTMAVHPDMEDDLYDIEGFISRDKIADTAALKDGVIGRVMGFDVILCADMPKVTSEWGRTAGTLPVALFYSSYAVGFGRQREFGAINATNVLTPGEDVNIFSVFGGVVQEDTMIIGYRKASA